MPFGRVFRAHPPFVVASGPGGGLSLLDEPTSPARPIPAGPPGPGGPSFRAALNPLRIVQPPRGSPRKPFDEAADLHIASIHHGLLPELGRDFLSRLYREINRTPNAGVWVAMDGDRVVGFLAGCADPGRCYRAVLGRAALPLTGLAGRSLLRRSVLTRLFTILKYPFRKADPVAGVDVPKPELLAVAVDPGARGRGIGAQLVEAFEQGLVSWGVSGRYRVATNVEEVVSNRFYERVGFAPAYQTSHNDLTLQVYVKGLPEST